MATKVGKPNTTRNFSWGISAIVVIFIGAAFVVEYLDSPAFALIIAFAVAIWIDPGNEDVSDLRLRSHFLAGVATLVAWVVTSLDVVPGFFFVPPLIIALVPSYVIFWRLDRALPIRVGQFHL